MNVKGSNTFSRFQLLSLATRLTHQKLLKILVLCSMRILISGLTSTTFANFVTVIYVTCAESENIWKWTKSSAWRLPLRPVCLTAAKFLVHGVAVRDMLELQRVQSCLARVVTRDGRFAPSIPLRPSLHWLPISFRIKFEILPLPYKTLSSGKPSYLANLIHLATPSRSLQFNKGPPLSAPITAILIPELESSVSVLQVLAATKFHCVFALLNPWLVFGNVLKTHLLGLSYPPHLADFPISWWWIYMAFLWTLCLQSFWLERPLNLTTPMIPAL